MSYTKLENHLIPNLDLSEKIKKNSYQAESILTLFCDLVSETFG